MSITVVETQGANVYRACFDGHLCLLVKLESLPSAPARDFPAASFTASSACSVGQASTNPDRSASARSTIARVSETHGLSIPSFSRHGDSSGAFRRWR
jgi:hypothetical protein